MNDSGTRERILQAAARLLADSGGAPVSTRAVCAAAGVGAPTLYHHFGDKDGLLDAVVAFGFDRYLAEKRSLRSTGDPVEDLRRGWDAHVEFGLAQPAFYALMYGAGRRAGRLGGGIPDPAAHDRAGRARRAAAGAGQDRRDMMHAASIGVTLQLISGGEQDPELSPPHRDAILAAIATDEAEDRPSSVSAMAIALTSALDGRTPNTLSEAETAMLREWLTRVAVE